MLEAIDEHRCTLRAGANSLDGLAVWISLIGCEFEVREPVDLVERMRWMAARLTRASDRSTG
ncbi:hypothetical protein [Actinokineospora sp.]|uniref:hypothetical protein n=1 Tax=Actinokineospora sp. TaxID=1872133 RepID=UPI00403830D0